MRGVFSILKITILLSWSIFCIFFAFIVYLLTLFRRKIPVYLASKMWAPGALRIMGAKLKIEGLDNIDKNKHYVIMANHSSYLDIAVLFKVMPFNIHFIGKKELKRVPFLGWYMVISGMIFIDRSNPKKAKKSIDEAIELVRKGFNVVIFPEGTTSDTGEIAKFKKGGFLMAKESQSPILPIHISGSANVWPTDSVTQLKAGKVSVKIGKAIEHPQYSQSSILENMHDVRQLIINLKKLTYEH